MTDDEPRSLQNSENHFHYLKDRSDKLVVNLEKSQRLLTQAMDLAHLVNWEYDVEQDFFTFNDRFYALYGTSAEREGGTKMSSKKYAREFVHPDDMHFVAEEVEKAIAATDPNFVSQLEHRIICRNGDIRYITVRFGVILDENGRCVKTYGANQDITDRKKSEDVLIKANRQLSLLAGITRHDILNKISAINIYLGLAELEYANPALIEYLRIIKTATNEIQSQIEFTRVYQDIGSLEPRWFLLDNVLPRSFFPVYITLTTDVNDYSIFADPMLEKVFFNLLDNSIRHGQRVTDIQVSVHELDGILNIIWEDNGVGIPEEQKAGIFEYGSGANTGFGLFLVREVLSLTGITIRETGTQGEGARFEIIIPKDGWRASR